MAIKISKEDSILRVGRPSTGDYILPEQYTNEIFYTTADSLEPHRYRSNLSIKYVIEGTENYEVNGNRISLNSNQMMVVNNGSDVVCSLDKRSTAFSIFIEEEIIREILLSKHGIDQPEQDKPAIEFSETLTNNENFDFLKSYLLQIRGEIENQQYETSDPLMLHYKIAELLLKGHFKNFELLKNISAIKKSTQEELLKRLSVAKAYLDETFKSKFDLTYVSKISSLSKYHLIRTFKSVYGFTPNQYVIQKRLACAKLLLTQNLHTNEEIAYLSGFYDVANFSNCFKNHTGLSPSAFKHRLHN